MQQENLKQLFQICYSDEPAARGRAVGAAKVFSLITGVGRTAAYVTKAGTYRTCNRLRATRETREMTSLCPLCRVAVKVLGPDIPWS